MPDPMPPLPRHLTWRHPIARWRHIACSPVYRLGTLDRSRRRAAAIICVATVLAIWFGLPPLGLSGLAGRATPVLLVFIEWGFLVAAACVAGTSAFWSERQSGTMDQLVLTPLDSYEVIRDRAFAAGAPLAPAFAVAAVLGLVGMLLPACDHPKGMWLYALVWLLIAANMLASVYLGLAIGMWMTFLLKWRIVALTLAILAMALIEALASFGMRAFLPVAILAPFGRVILAGLVLAHCERLFNRQRLPGEDDGGFSEPSCEREGAEVVGDDVSEATGGEAASRDPEQL